jgi:hypothetical protein
MLIKGRVHTAVLLESAPFFQKQSAHSVKDCIISAVDRERKRLSGKVAAGGFQALNGFVPPEANRLCFGVFSKRNALLFDDLVNRQGGGNTVIPGLAVNNQLAEVWSHRRDSDQGSCWKSDRDLVIGRLVQDDQQILVRPLDHRTSDDGTKESRIRSTLNSLVSSSWAD